VRSSCNEIQVNQAIHQGFRGARSRLWPYGTGLPRIGLRVSGPSASRPCPTGALWKSTSAQGAALETRGAHHLLLLWVGVQLELGMKDNRGVQVPESRTCRPNYGSLCVKGRFGFDFIASPERLTHP